MSCCLLMKQLVLTKQLPFKPRGFIQYIFHFWKNLKTTLFTVPGFGCWITLFLGALMALNVDQWNSMINISRPVLRKLVSDINKMRNILTNMLHNDTSGQKLHSYGS